MRTTNQGRVCLKAPSRDAIPTPRAAFGVCALGRVSVHCCTIQSPNYCKNHTRSVPRRICKFCLLCCAGSMALTPCAIVTFHGRPSVGVRHTFHSHRGLLRKLRRNVWRRLVERGGSASWTNSKSLRTTCPSRMSCWERAGLARCTWPTTAAATPPLRY